MNIVENKTFEEIQIGQSASLTRTLTPEDISMFAVLSGDVNPTHFSVEYAEKILNNKKIVGHTMWSGSLISGLLGNELPGPGTVYKKQDLTFHRPIELGDTLTVTIKVTAKEPESATVVFDCLGVNQAGETVMTGTAHVQAPRVKLRGERVRLPEFMVRHNHQVFNSLVERCQDLDPVTVAVCHPCDQVSLQGAVEAAEKRLILPTLVGPRERIEAVAQECGLDISPYPLVDSVHSHHSAEQAVALCRAGEAEALMKGSLHTDEMMQEVMNRATGLRTERRISHVFVMDVPTYPRTLLITDAAINIYPTLEDKRDIVQNAIELSHVLGVPVPKVAILSAVETIYPKISSTIEAAALCKMADRGQITGGILDGPLAFDNAISEEAVRIKKITSPVAGRADILVVPDLETGNMLAKQLSYMANAEAAGVVLGARVPIILTSRADSAKARLASCAVAVLFAHGLRSGAASVLAQ